MPKLLSIARLVAPALALALLPSAAGAQQAAPSEKPVLGFYLHACWDYRAPFAVRKWSPDDYQRMLRLLQRFDYNTVMFWPVTEAIPMPISDEDRQALERFRDILAGAQQMGHRAWLVTCPNLGVPPEIAKKPWMERNFWPSMIHYRLDDAEQKQTLLARRQAIFQVLNNADAYITIDGDPGGYAGAKPEDWFAVFAADRQVIDEFGTAPEQQLIVPWLWSGWGTRGVWGEPIDPFIDAELKVLLENWDQLTPALLLAGRGGPWRPYYRDVIKVVERQQAIDRSVLFCYAAVEREPSPPAPELRFDWIRRMVIEEESQHRDEVRGWMANAQQPIMVIPNIYLFARCVQDPAYAEREDRAVLQDCAKLFGGPEAALVTAWSCLQLPLEELPESVATQLRQTPFDGPAANDLPGGEQTYREILASAVDCRRAVLLAVQSPTDVQKVEAAVAALGKWWALSRYAFSQTAGDGQLNWGWIHHDLVGPLRAAARGQRDQLLPHQAQFAAALANSAGLTPAAAQRAVEQLLAP